MKFYAIPLSIAVLLLLNMSTASAITSTAAVQSDTSKNLGRDHQHVKRLELITVPQIDPSLSAKERRAIKRANKKKEKMAKLKNGQSLAFVGMLLGVLALAGGGYLLGIPALVLSAISLRRMRKTGERKLHPFASAGLITGILACLVIGFKVIVFILFC